MDAEEEASWYERHKNHLFTAFYILLALLYLCYFISAMCLRRVDNNSIYLILLTVFIAAVIAWNFLDNTFRLQNRIGHYTEEFYSSEYGIRSRNVIRQWVVKTFSLIIVLRTDPGIIPCIFQTITFIIYLLILLFFVQHFGRDILRLSFALWCEIIIMPLYIYIIFSTIFTPLCYLVCSSLPSVFATSVFIFITFCTALSYLPTPLRSGRIWHKVNF